MVSLHNAKSGFSAYEESSSCIDTHSLEQAGILSELPDVLTLEQTANVLQISITNARQMCREKRLPSFKCGAQWRVPKTWLCEYMYGDIHAQS